MLSNKWTFSLTILAMLIALGFAFTPAVLGAVDTVPDPEISLTDVSEANGNQLEVYPAITAPTAADATDTQAKIDALPTAQDIADDKNIEFYIRLKKGYARLAGASPVDEDLAIADLTIKYYDIKGAEVAAGTTGTATITHLNPSFPDGRNFKVTIPGGLVGAAARYMSVELPADSFEHAEPTDVRNALIAQPPVELKMNTVSNILRFELVNEEPSGNKNPDVVSIVRLIPTAAAATSRITEAAVRGPFQVKVTFTEEPNLPMKEVGIAKHKILDVSKMGDVFDLENAKITDIYKGAPFFGVNSGTLANFVPDAAEGNYTAVADIPLPSGRDARYHPYYLEITPNLTTADDVVIRVKDFKDLVKPPNSFNPPNNLALAQNRSVLRVRVQPGAITSVDDISDSNVKALAAAGAGGTGVFIDGGLVIPKNGYLVLVRGTATEAGVRSVSANKYKDNDNRERADNQTDADFSYNIKESFVFPAAVTDLDNFFRNGGTISLSYKDIPEASVGKNKLTGYQGSRSDEDLGELDPAETIAAGDVVINEIMWARDESLTGADGPPKAQWIELHNTQDYDISIDANEWALTFGGSDPAGFDNIDSVSTLSPSYWILPGQSGRTSAGGAGQPITNLISASRVDASASGRAQANWAPSMRVGTNLGINRIGTPGVANVADTSAQDQAAQDAQDAQDAKAAADKAAADAAAAAAKADPATPSDLRITEIMVPSNGGVLPQWIEITNKSAARVSLDGWRVSIDNDAADADVITTSLGIKLDGVVLDAGHVALVVSKTGRNSGTDIAGNARTDGDANAGNFDADRIVDASAQLEPAARNYSILSEMAFRISLEPPSPITSGADVVGNLVGGWELPMSEGERSSIIRREMDGGAEIAGTDAAGWKLAADTSLAEAYVATYYGDKDDMGTPGYNAGGALPVELSKFTAARDRVTGQVTIAWETQSELNNAGFFIKRNEHRTGQFKVVNPTMIPGAGTTSEKQSYTYTDTTAKPNIVYYYQIEDVSLDGQRQTLTRSHRLKGHIGAAGKATTTWGELKERE